MVELAIYHRDGAGLIVGPQYQTWMSTSQALTHYLRFQEPGVEAEYEELKGWPHEAVIWYGSVGIALPNYEKEAITDADYILQWCQAHDWGYFAHLSNDGERVSCLWSEEHGDFIQLPLDLKAIQQWAGY